MNIDELDSLTPVETYDLGKIHGLEEAARTVQVAATALARRRAKEALGEFIGNKLDGGTSVDDIAFDVRSIGDRIAEYAHRLRREMRRKKNG